MADKSSGLLANVPAREPTHEIRTVCRDYRSCCNAALDRTCTRESCTPPRFPCTDIPFAGCIQGLRFHQSTLNQNSVSHLEMRRNEGRCGVRGAGEGNGLREGRTASRRVATAEIGATLSITSVGQDYSQKRPSRLCRETRNAPYPPTSQPGKTAEHGKQTADSGKAPV